MMLLVLLLLCFIIVIMVADPSIPGEALLDRVPDQSTVSLQKV